MTTLEAIELIEHGGVPSGPAYVQGELLEAWQYLIDTGVAWRLQDFYGRSADALIRQGVCHAPP